MPRLPISRTQHSSHFAKHRRKCFKNCIHCVVLSATLVRLPRNWDYRVSTLLNHWCMIPETCLFCGWLQPARLAMSFFRWLHVAHYVWLVVIVSRKILFVLGLLQWAWLMRYGNIEIWKWWFSYTNASWSHIWNTVHLPGANRILTVFMYKVILTEIFMLDYDICHTVLTWLTSL